jgi:hypothetical protein
MKPRTTVAALLLILSFAAALPQAPPPSGPPVKQCLAKYCKPQIEACVSDPVCNKGVQCVESCSPVTEACVKACIQASLDQMMLAVGLCAESHHCLPTGSTPAATNSTLH